MMLSLQNILIDGELFNIKKECMKQITEQMLQDRFAVGFMFGIMSTVLVSVASIGFYIYFTQKYKQ